MKSLFSTLILIFAMGCGGDGGGGSPSPGPADGNSTPLSQADRATFVKIMGNLWETLNISGGAGKLIADNCLAGKQIDPNDTIVIATNKESSTACPVELEYSIRVNPVGPATTRRMRWLYSHNEASPHEKTLKAQRDVIQVEITDNVFELVENDITESDGKGEGFIVSQEFGRILVKIETKGTQTFDPASGKYTSVSGGTKMTYNMEKTGLVVNVELKNTIGKEGFKTIDYLINGQPMTEEEKKAFAGGF